MSFIPLPRATCTIWQLRPLEIPPRPPPPSARSPDQLLKQNMFTTPDAVAEKLFKLRYSLIVLKQDRTTYVKSSSVVRLYDELCEYIRQAQEFETELLNGPRESGGKREAVSRLVAAIFPCALSNLLGANYMSARNLTLQLVNW